MRRAVGCALGWLLCACSGVEAGDGSSDVGATEPGNPELAAPGPNVGVGSSEPFASSPPEPDGDVVGESSLQEPPALAELPIEMEVGAPEVAPVLMGTAGGVGAGASSGIGADEQGTQTGDQGSGGGGVIGHGGAAAGGAGGSAAGGAGPCDPVTESALPEETRWRGTFVAPDEAEAAPPSGANAEVTVELTYSGDATSACRRDVAATLIYSSEALSFSTTFILTIESTLASGELSVASEQLGAGTLLPELELFAPVESEPTMPAGLGGGGAPAQGNGGSVAEAGAGSGGQSGIAGASAPAPDGEEESSMCRVNPLVPDSNAPLGVSLAGSVLLDPVAGSMQLSLSWVRREDGEARWYTLPYGCAETARVSLALHQPRSRHAL